jgi:aspartokinase-like uncharacterized kinase
MLRNSTSAQHAGMLRERIYCALTALKVSLMLLIIPGGWNNADHVFYTEIQDMFKATMKKASGTTGTTKSE